MRTPILYKPKTLEDIIGNEKTTDELYDIFQTNTITNYGSFLFTGITGCGKTALANLVKKNLPYTTSKDYFKFNFKTTTRWRNDIDNEKDSLNKITFYSMYRGFDRNQIFYIDNIDLASINIQKELCQIIDSSSTNTYFIFCAINSLNVIPRLKIRCAQFKVKPLTSIEMKEFIYRVIDKNTFIINDNTISVINKSISLIMDFAKGIPRKAILAIQRIIDGIPIEVKNNSYIKEVLFQQEKFDSIKYFMAAEDLNKFYPDGISRKEEKEVKKTRRGEMNLQIGGNAFTLTGQGPMTRNDLTNIILQAGGYVQGISKSTDILVTNSIYSNSRKMKLAKQWNIKIIDYGELMQALSFKGDYPKWKDRNTIAPVKKQKEKEKREKPFSNWEVEDGYSIPREVMRYTTSSLRRKDKVEPEKEVIKIDKKNLKRAIEI